MGIDTPPLLGEGVVGLLSREGTVLVVIKLGSVVVLAKISQSRCTITCSFTRGDPYLREQRRGHVSREYPLKVSVGTISATFMVAF